MKLKNAIILLISAMIIAGSSGDMSAYQSLSSSVSVTSQGTIPLTIGPLLDDFSKGTSMNLWGCTTSTVTRSGTSASLAASYPGGVSLPPPLGATGRCLQLTYDVTDSGPASDPYPGSWAAYVTSLGDASINNYNYLSFWVKGALGREYFKIELHHKNYDYTKPVGYNSNYKAEVYVTDYLDGGVTTGWRKVVIPLDAFANINDRTKIKELVFTFEYTQSTLNDNSPKNSTVYISNISFGKQFQGFVRVDHFGDKVSKNAIGGNCTMLSETSPVNPQGTAHGSYAYQNSEYVSSIYGLWFYFQDVWDINTPIEDHRYLAYVSTVGGGDTGFVPQPRNFGAYKYLSFQCKSSATNITTLKVELHCPTYTNSFFHFFTRKNFQDPITTTWKEYTIPLSSFTSNGWTGQGTSVTAGATPAITSLGEVVFTRDGWVSGYGDWDGGAYTGSFYIDKIQFQTNATYTTDGNSPAAPAAPTYVSGGTITLSCTASSDATDLSMECVAFQYYAGGVWKTIGYDYDTADSTYTVQWDTSSLPRPFLYGVRAVAMDAAGNSAVSVSTNVGG